MYLGTINVVDEASYREQSQWIGQLARGNFEPVATQLLRDYPRSNLPVRAVPFAQRYVAELAGLYQRRTLRRFVGADGAAAKMVEAYDDAAIDTSLAEIEQALWVQNTVLALVLPNGVGRVRVHYVEPWRVEQIDVADALAAADPRSWDRIVLKVPSTVTAGQTVDGRVELTRTEAWRETGGERRGIYSADGSHPFGMVPLVVAHRVRPAGGRWRAPINEAVLNLQLGLSTQTADDEVIVRHCAFPQKVIENATIAQRVSEMQVGPDKVLTLLRGSDPQAPAPTLRVVQGQVPVAELVSFTEHKIRMYCAMLGIDSTSFIRTNTAVTASARLFASQDRDAQRAKIKPVLRKLETDLARLVGAVLSLRDPVPVPAKISATVTWAQPHQSADPAADAQASQVRISLGLASAASILARELGVTLAEAEAIVIRNLEFTHALPQTGTESGPPEQEPAEDDGGSADDEQPDPGENDLNGAQVTAVLSVAQQVASGAMSSAAGVELLALSFPSMDRAALARMIARAAESRGSTDDDADPPTEDQQ